MPFWYRFPFFIWIEDEKMTVNVMEKLCLYVESNLRRINSIRYIAIVRSDYAKENLSR